MQSRHGDPPDGSWHVVLVRTHGNFDDRVAKVPAAYQKVCLGQVVVGDGWSYRRGQGVKEFLT